MIYYLLHFPYYHPVVSIADRIVDDGVYYLLRLPLTSTTTVNMISLRGVVSTAADGSGTLSSSSTFYIHPDAAAIRVAVAVATADAAPPPPTAIDDDDDNDD